MSKFRFVLSTLWVVCNVQDMVVNLSVSFPHCWPAEGEAVQQDRAMEPPEDADGRSFVEVISEKYSPENFPYRRGPGMGVVVVPTIGLQGSPMKGELEEEALLF